MQAKSGWARLSGHAYGGLVVLTSKGKDFALLPIIVSLLGLDGYGLFVQVVLLASVVSILSTCGMDVSLIRHFFRSDGDREFAVATAVVALIGLLLSVLWFAVAGIVLQALSLPSGVAYLVPIIALLESYRAVTVSYYRASQRFSRIAIFIAFDVAEVLVFAVVWTLVPSVDLGTVLLVYAIIRALPIALTTAELRPAIHRVKFETVRDRIRFGVVFIPKEFLVWAGHSVDRFIVSYLLGPVAVGVYAAAYKVASVLRILSTPISFVGFPVLSAAWDRPGRADFRKLRAKYVRYYLALAVPIVVFLFVAADWLLSLLDDAFEGYGFIAAWTSVGIVFHTVQSISGYYLYVLADRMVEYVKIIGWIYLVGLGLQYLLIQRYGLHGAVVSSVMIYVIMWAIVTWRSAVIR